MQNTSIMTFVIFQHHWYHILYTKKKEENHSIFPTLHQLSETFYDSTAKIYLKKKEYVRSWIFFFCPISSLRRFDMQISNIRVLSHNFRILACKRKIAPLNNHEHRKYLTQSYTVHVSGKVRCVKNTSIQTTHFLSFGKSKLLEITNATSMELFHAISSIKVLIYTKLNNITAISIMPPSTRKTSKKMKMYRKMANRFSKNHKVTMI